MSAAGSANRYDVDLGVGQHFVQVVISAAAVLFGKLVGRLRPPVVASDKPGILEIADRAGVEIRDHATPNDAETEYATGCHGAFARAVGMNGTVRIAPKDS